MSLTYISSYCSILVYTSRHSVYIVKSFCSIAFPLRFASCSSVAVSHTPHPRFVPAFFESFVLLSQCQYTSKTVSELLETEIAHNVWISRHTHTHLLGVMALVRETDAAKIIDQLRSHLADIDDDYPDPKSICRIIVNNSPL